MKTDLFAAAGFAALPFMAFADEFAVGDLVISDPISYETPVTAQTGVGYLSITNTGDVDEKLIDVRADFPRVMVHETIIDGDITRMQHVMGGLVIPAGATVSLEPGSFHIMFMGLGGDPFEVGEDIPATLVFETAGELDIVFKVEARVPATTGQTGTDMSDIDHDDMHEEDGE